MDFLGKLKKYIERRLGSLEVRERGFAHVGAELGPRSDFSVSATQNAFTDESELAPTRAVVWANRQRHLTPGRGATAHVNWDNCAGWQPSPAWKVLLASLDWLPKEMRLEDCDEFRIKI